MFLQNYTRPHFTTPGYIMSPHAHGNGVALHEPAARDFANGMGTPFQASDEYGQDAVDSYCGGGDVGNKAPAVPFNLPAAQQLPQEPAPHQSGMSHYCATSKLYSYATTLNLKFLQPKMT